MYKIMIDSGRLFRNDWVWKVLGRLEKTSRQGLKPAGILPELWKG
jgi:hypothetical protein